MAELFLSVTDEMRGTYEKAAEKYNATPYEERDSGFDVYCDSDYYLTYGADTVFLRFGIVAACAIKNGGGRAYWLMPRSSISKTPFVCANSMGLIDAGYRGQLMGAVRMVQDAGLYTVSTGTRIFQLVAGSAKPWARIIIVGLPADMPRAVTARGTGGFGSTGS
jgi:dUTP pyrophosphatase